MNEFFKIYDEIAEKYIVYMELKKITSGIPRWRLSVFGLDGTHLRDGDAEILFVEDKDREEAFKKAAVLLKEREKEFKTIHQILEEEFKDIENQKKGECA